LGSNVDHAVEIVHGWFKSDPALFQFRGGRLLAIAFPNFPPIMADKLLAIVAQDGGSSLDFISDILIHYHGSVATHGVLQALVSCLPAQDERLGDVRRLLRSTGVVSGEFGMAEAYERKVVEIELWQSDARPKVRNFALTYIKSMQQSIAAEYSQSEQKVAMSKLEWGLDLDGKSANEPDKGS
jgi:hypothetical protein